MQVEKLWDKLRKILDENQILRNEPMKRHTTFQTGERWLKSERPCKRLPFPGKP